jgi:hypothetical protein
MTHPARLIRASEVGEYVFCRRAWWLHHVRGIEPADRVSLEKGVAQHREHGQIVQSVNILQCAAVIFLGIALSLAVLHVFTAILATP